jgi:photosystem II stability/assembly factor-like uncharacterized protein
MKNFTFTLLMLMTGLTFSSSLAQGSWNLRTINGVTGGGAIQFLNANEGWMSTYQGGLIHTTNGGLNWNQVSLNPTDVIYSYSETKNLSFITTSIGWVLKSFGTEENPLGVVVYKTIDGGTTWGQTVISNAAGEVGYEIQFVDENNGWLVYFNINTGNFTYLKTTDGGNTWIPTSGQGIFHFINSTTGWAFTAGISLNPPFNIYKTTNAGTNWATQFSDNSPGHLQAIYFSDANNGWVVGLAGKIYKTNNGGENFYQVTNTGISQNVECTSVYFLNSTTGWIGCTDISQNSSNYFILHTTDGGTSWTTQTTNITNNGYWVVNLFFWDENNGWFASDNNQIAQYSSPLAIKENLLNNYLSIYPNPNTGTFYFSIKNSSSKVKVEIFTLLGQKVFEVNNLEMRPQNQINFTPQSKGVYLVKIGIGENSYSEKILIQ